MEYVDETVKNLMAIAAIKEHIGTECDPCSTMAIVFEDLFSVIEIVKNLQSANPALQPILAPISRALKATEASLNILGSKFDPVFRAYGIEDTQKERTARNNREMAYELHYLTPHWKPGKL